MEFRRATPRRPARDPWHTGPAPSRAGRRRSSPRSRRGWGPRPRWPPASATTPSAARWSSACSDGVRGEGIVVAPASHAVALVAYRDEGTRDFWFSVRDSAAMVRRGGRAAGGPRRLAPRLGSTLGFGGGPHRPRGRRGAGARARRPAFAGPERTGRRRRRLREGWRVSRARRTCCSPPRASSRPRSRSEDLAGRASSLRDARTGRRAPLDPEPVPVHVGAVDEVDPTGAGDTFAAAFVTALRDGDDASAAAFGCRDGGGLGRRPGRDGGAGRTARGRAIGRGPPS